MTKEQFLDECRFAKLVVTKDGAGILIGGIVFNVQGYPGIDGYAEWLVDALRATQLAQLTGDAALAQGTLGDAS